MADQTAPKQSRLYRALFQAGIRLSPRFAQVDLVGTIKTGFWYWWQQFLNGLVQHSILFGPLTTRWARPMLLRLRGCKVGKGVFIGDGVYVDLVYPHLITIEDGAFVCARAILLAHNRDISAYRRGIWIGDVPHITRPVRVGRGAHIGMGAILLPGTTVGEGAIVGAGSVVARDIPPYTIAVGVPAKVIREVPE